MPSLPPRACGVPGCTNYALAGKGRCVNHIRKPLTEYREKTNAMYKTGRWREKRRKQLAREPLCRECMKQNKLTDATEVDHIVPHNDYYEQLAKEGAQDLTDAITAGEFPGWRDVNDALEKVERSTWQQVSGELGEAAPSEQWYRGFLQICALAGWLLPRRQNLRLQ